MSADCDSDWWQSGHGAPPLLSLPLQTKLTLIKGFSTAESLLKAGYKVTISCRSKEKGDEAVAALKTHGTLDMHQVLQPGRTCIFNPAIDKLNPHHIIVHQIHRFFDVPLHS